ncbi:MAG TPA: hypothetical protein VKV26_06160 [Dehalococcoidia bacterium]|nr:hypothetical protein [Dehalococcoidia bacterium]
MAAGCLLPLLLWAALLAISPPTRLAARTLTLLPSFFAALPGSPIDLVTARPVREVVELPPVDGYVRAHIYRPPHGRHPALVLSLGLDPAPPDDVRVVRLMDGLARSGLVAVLVESEALNGDRLAPDLPRALVEGVQFAAEQPYTRPDRVGIFGFSVGGSLAIVAATDPAIRDRLRNVDAFGSFATLGDALLSIGTHTLDDRGAVRPWNPNGIASEHLTNVLLAGLDDAQEAAALHGYFVEGDVHALDGVNLSPEGQAIKGLLSSRDRAEGKSYVPALPASLQANLAALSPLPRVSQVRARLFIMYDRDDPLLPFTGSRDLCAAARAAGLKPYCSAFSIFQHVDPKRAGNPITLVHDLTELYLHAFAVLRSLQ